jgi:hypothetical protein
MTDPFGGPLDSFALALEDKSSQTLDNYSRAVLASWLYITVDHDKQVALVRGPAAEWAVYVISPADFTWAPNLVAVRCPRRTGATGRRTPETSCPRSATVGVGPCPPRRIFAIRIHQRACLTPRRHVSARSTS